MTRGRLFFIMPFGVRQVGLTSQEHDFDAVYQQLLRPVALAEDWEPLRIDEVVAPGLVTSQAIQQLLTAELVVADVSSANGNVYYELGVRQAIAPSGTILLALQGTRLPFDIANQRVLFYGPDFVADEAFKESFARALREWRPGRSENSPVRAALEQLALVSPGPQTDPASFERELDLKIARAHSRDQLVAVWHWARHFSPLPASALLTLAARLADGTDYEKALEVVTRAAETQPDYEVLRMRGFYLRHLNDLDGAANEFRRSLELNPNDPETLGMLGGLYKRSGRYGDALASYRRGIELSPANLYMRVNEAALTILADSTAPDEGLRLYTSLLTTLSSEPQFADDPWSLLVRAEAAFALGDEAQSRDRVAEAARHGAGAQDLRSFADQLRLFTATGFRAELAGRLEDFARSLAAGGGDPQAPTPAPAESHYAEHGRRLIVHLSDPHFGSTVRNGLSVNMHRFFDGENSVRLSKELIGEIRRAATNGNYAPDEISIVLSGDLTYTASADEFRMVETFLVELCEGLQLDRERIVVVPGNHDVDWRLAAIDLTHRFDNYLTFVRSFYGTEAFRRLFPLVDWDFDVAGERPAANQIVQMVTHGDVAFLGLNSCVFESDQHHYGFVGLRQLDMAASLLDELPPETVRVAVMHHHLHPFPEVLEAREGSDVWVDMSTVRDAGIVEQRLEQLGFDIVLHGHKHKPQLRETLVRHRVEPASSRETSLVISGAGSVGVNARELEQNESNHYALIEVLRPQREPGADFLRVEWRELSHIPGASWSTQKRWVLKG